MNIEDYLSEGRENALSMADLALILNVKKRTVRTMILTARISGSPICSTCQGNRRGYFMPRNADEARIYLHEQTSRIRTSRAALHGVKKFIASGGADNG